MSLEKPTSKEGFAIVIPALIKELGYLNLNATLFEDEEDSKLIMIDGALDITEGAGNDQDIEQVLEKFTQQYPTFTCTYDYQGAIKVEKSGLISN